MLQDALPRLGVVQEVDVQLPHNRVRVPDITVVEHPPEGHFVVDPPVLVVEILSPSTRSEDTVRKSAEYAAAGIGQFWVLDPEFGILDVFANVDGGWETVAHLDHDHPTATIAVGDHGSVDVDLTVVLAG